MPDKNPPWKRQRNLKTQDIPIYEHILNISKTYKDIQERALFILTYLTAGRISEIVNKQYLYKNQFKKGENGKVARNANKSPIIERREKVEINYPGILKKDIVFAEKKGKKLMIISMANRKNRQLKRKNIPISVEREAELINMLNEYTSTLSDDNPLFNFKIGKAEKIIAKCGMNPHFLRDIRLTHLVTIYDFGGFLLTKFAGWKDARPSEVYIRLSLNDIIDKY